VSYEGNLFEVGVFKPIFKRQGDCNKHVGWGKPFLSEEQVMEDPKTGINLINS
jgi:hypothetical protein